MIPRKVFTIFAQIPRNCQCKWLLLSSSAPRTLVTSIALIEKNFWHGMIASTVLPILHHLVSQPRIDDCFETHILYCCHQITKISALATTLPIRLLEEALPIRVLEQKSQFGSFGKCGCTISFGKWVKMLAYLVSLLFAAPWVIHENQWKCLGGLVHFHLPSFHLSCGCGVGACVHVTTVSVPFLCWKQTACGSSDLPRDEMRWHGMSPLLTSPHLNKRGTAALYRCLSTSTTSSFSEVWAIAGCTPWISKCHSSMSSVACLKYRRNFHDRVAATVSFTHVSKNPMLWFGTASYLVCSLVSLLQCSRERVFSCASVALRLNSTVRWLAFFTATQVLLHESLKRLLTSLAVVLSTLAHAALCKDQQFVNSLAAVTIPSHVNFKSSCWRAWSFRALSNSSHFRSHCVQHVALFVLKRHLFHGLIERKSQIPLPKVTKTCMVFGWNYKLWRWPLHFSCTLRLAFPFAFPELWSYCSNTCRVHLCGVDRFGCLRNSLNIFRTVATLATTLNRFTSNVLGRIVRLTIIPLIAPSLLFSKISAGAPHAPPRATVPCVLLIGKLCPLLIVPRKRHAIFTRSIFVIVEEVFDRTLLLVNRNGPCATRRCETRDPKRHANNEFTQHVRPKWCLHDARKRNRSWKPSTGSWQCHQLYVVGQFSHTNMHQWIACRNTRVASDVINCTPRSSSSPTQVMARRNWDHPNSDQPRTKMAQNVACSRTAMKNELWCHLKLW